MTQNQISYWKLQEDRRANQTKEAETNRHNLASESIDAEKADATLAKALNNPFSLISYGAGLEQNAGQGVRNLFSNVGKAAGASLQGVKDLIKGWSQQSGIGANNTKNW